MTVGDRAWMEQATLRLVRIASVSGNEIAAQAEVEALMIEAGASSVRRVPVDADRLREAYGFASPSRVEGMHSLVGTWLGDGPGRHVILNGHIDTVEAGVGWERDPLDAVVDDGRIVGLGSADMKAGLVSAIAAAARAAASGALRGRVDVQSVPDEEVGGGTGSLTCVDDLLRRAEPKPDLVIVCEPTSLRIASTQVGSRSLAFRLHGIEAHANTKHLGLSAVELAMDLAGRLLAWVGTLTTEPHPLLPPRAVNIGRIHGGDGATKVAAQCDLEVCITYHPADADAAVTEIDAIVANWLGEQDPRLRLDTTQLHNVRPFATDPEAAAVRALVTATGDGARPFVGFPAGSDGRFFHDLLGSPTVIFGPGDIAVAHRPEEGVPIDEVVAHAETLQRLLTAPADIR